MLYRYNIPAIIWGIIIFILLSIPGGNVPRFTFLKDLPIDKIVHFFLFMVFSFLLLYGFVKQYNNNYSRFWLYAVAFLISVAYGGLTELLQGTVFVKRTCDLVDFVTDTAGAIFGIIVCVWMVRKKGIKKETEKNA